MIKQIRHSVKNFSYDKRIIHLLDSCIKT